MVQDKRRLETGLRVLTRWVEVARFLLGCRRVRRMADLVVVQGMRWRSGRLPVRPVWRRERRETKVKLITRCHVVVEVDRDEEAEEELTQLVLVAMPGQTRELKEGRETQGAGPKLEPGDPRKWDQQRNFQRLQPRGLQELKTLTCMTMAVFMLWMTHSGLELRMKLILSKKVRASCLLLTRS